jgi:hypothetical protein
MNPDLSALGLCVILPLVRMKGSALVFALVLLCPLQRVAAGGLDAWQAEKPPRLRVAASPYPNFLLEILPTGVDFGEHVYRVKIDSLGMGPSSETPRGHFYTRRGGFLDLAHIRRAIDMAGYVHYHVREGLTRGEVHFSFENIDRTTYHTHFSYPAVWEKLDAATKARLVDEIAIRAAEEAAIDFSNWREILTWYDFHNLPGMPERGSAFSYEDLPSHAVGAAVAARALRLRGVPFDEAVTKELDRELKELEVVPSETYERAMALVAERWWGKKTCYKRHLDTGLDDGVITPWLVRGLEAGSPLVAKGYPAPRGLEGRVMGYDCRGMVVFSCEPRPGRQEVKEAVLPEGGRTVIPMRDYPVILERIAGEIRGELGPHALEPYP